MQKKLPNPDEVKDLYEPKMYKPRIIGKTYWYIIQRTAGTGSLNERNEKLVRITFDLNGVVIKLDHWRF